MMIITMIQFIRLIMIIIIIVIQGFSLNNIQKISGTSKLCLKIPFSEDVFHGEATK